MPKLTLTIEISPALADLASREAWRQGLGWREWVGQEAERLLAERAEMVCWPAARERADRVSYL